MSRRARLGHLWEGAYFEDELAHLGDAGGLVGLLKALQVIRSQDEVSLLPLGKQLVPLLPQQSFSQRLRTLSHSLDSLSLAVISSADVVKTFLQEKLKQYIGCAHLCALISLFSKARERTVSGQIWEKWTEILSSHCGAVKITRK